MNRTLSKILKIKNMVLMVYIEIARSSIELRAEHKRGQNSWSIPHMDTDKGSI